MVKVDLGNNESVVAGVFEEANGTFTVLTATKFWTYKTEGRAWSKWDKLVAADLV